MKLSRRTFITGGSISIGASFAASSGTEAYVGFLHRSGIGQVIAPFMNAVAPTNTPTSFMTTLYSGRGTAAPIESTALLGDGSHTEQIIGNIDLWDFYYAKPGEVVPVTFTAGNGDFIQNNIASTTILCGDGVTFASSTTNVESQSSTRWTFGFVHNLQMPDASAQPSLASAPLYVDVHPYINPTNGYQRKAAVRRIKILASTMKAVWVSNGSVGVASPGSASVGSFSTALLRTGQAVPRPSSVVPFKSVNAAAQYAAINGINFVFYDDLTGANPRTLNRNIAAKGYLTSISNGGVTSFAVLNTVASVVEQFDPLFVGQNITIGGVSLQILAIQDTSHFTCSTPSGWSDVTKAKWYYQFTQQFATTYLEDNSYYTTNTAAFNFEPVEIRPQSGVIGWQNNTCCFSRRFYSSLDRGSPGSFSWSCARVLLWDTFFDLTDVVHSFDVLGTPANGNKIHLWVNCGLVDSRTDADVGQNIVGGYDGIIGSPVISDEPGYCGFVNCVSRVVGTAADNFCIGSRFSGGWDINYWGRTLSGSQNVGRYDDVSSFYYDLPYVQKTKSIALITRDAVFGKTFAEFAKERFGGVAVVSNIVTKSGVTTANITTLNSYAQDASGNYTDLAPHFFSLYEGTGGVAGFNIAIDTGPLAGIVAANDFTTPTGLFCATITTATPCSFGVSFPANPNVTDSTAVQRCGGFSFTSGGEYLPNSYGTPCFIRSCANSPADVYSFDRNDAVTAGGPSKDRRNIPQGSQGSYLITGGNQSFVSSNAFPEGGGYCIYLGVAGGPGAGHYRKPSLPTDATNVVYAGSSTVVLRYTRTSNGVTYYPLSRMIGVGAAGADRTAAPVTISGNTVTARGVNGTTQSGAPSTTISSANDGNGILVTCNGALPAARYGGVGGNFPKAFGYGCTIRDGSGNAIGYVAPNCGTELGYSLSGTTKFYLIPLNPSTFTNFSNIAWQWSYDDHQAWPYSFVYVLSTDSNGVTTATVANVTACNGDTLTTDAPLGDTTTPVTLNVCYSATKHGVAIIEAYYDQFGNSQSPTSGNLSTGDQLQPTQHEHNDIYQDQSEAASYHLLQNIVLSGVTAIGNNPQLTIYGLGPIGVNVTATLDSTTQSQSNAPTLTFVSIDAGVTTLGADLVNTARNATAYKPLKVYTMVLSGTGASAFAFTAGVSGWRFGCNTPGGQYFGSTFKLYSVSGGGTSLTVKFIDDQNVFGGSVPAFTMADTFLNPICLTRGHAVTIGNPSTTGEIRGVRAVDPVTGIITWDRPWTRFSGTQTLTIEMGQKDVLFRSYVSGDYQNGAYTHDTFLPGMLDNSSTGQDYQGSISNYVYEQCSLGVSPGGSSAQFFARNDVVSMYFKNSIVPGSWYRYAVSGYSVGGQDWFDGEICKADNCCFGHLIDSTKTIADATAFTGVAPGNNTNKMIVNTDGSMRPLNLYDRSVTPSVIYPLSSGKLRTCSPRHRKMADGTIVASGVLTYIGAMPASPQAA